MNSKNWRLALFAWGGLLATLDSVCAQSWTQTAAPNKTWTGIASSADGGKLIAVGLSWNCFTSTNFGAFWISNSEPQYNSLIGSWNSVASSADGTRLLAGTVSSSFWASTNSGAFWLSNNVPGVTAWGSVAVSADGGKLFIAAGGNGHPAGPICVSTNSGTTWNITSAPTNVWTGLASSADGNKLVAVTGGSSAYRGFIYVSTNSGTTWLQTTAPSNYWMAVASSADGTKLAAVYYKDTNGVPGHIYTSTDSGNTWTSNQFAASFWQAVAMSADGNRLVVGGELYNNFNIYVSTNFGAAWVSNNLSSASLVSVTSSADGGRLFAAALSAQIFSAQSVVTPRLNLTPAISNLALSWIIPSTNFVIQRISSLTATNWAAVTDVPMLNFTNLQNQVFLAPTNIGGFFRLATP
jgi:hypothetical protein